MIKEQYPESELTGRIIGCAMEVHKIIGNGFQEVIYQRALAIEMTACGSLIAVSMKWIFFIKGPKSGNEELISL